MPANALPRNDDANALDDLLQRVARDARDRCVAAGIPLEHLAEYVPPTRRLFGMRPARFASIGRGWRLGVVVIDEHGQLWRAGATLRAHEPPPHKGYTAESARARDEMRHAAIRGGYAEGTVVHYDCREITAASLQQASAAGDASPADGDQPVVLRGQAIYVRWSAHCAIENAVPLEQYLAERLELIGA
ncbi:hypothetical protein [Gulosibacter bifidus]|uniref:Glutaminase n=1 Tax=Gulosibacter bifidus TaxID=272239 RepID=A0ABW5RGL4_9MICO|nr:hypothetical protein [Gulosibacter bifidus]